MSDIELKNKLKTDYFIAKAKLVHGDKYDYSGVDYINARKHVKIGCPEGHTFYQIPYAHLNGHGCPYCNSHRVNNQEELLELFKKIHGDKFDYSKVNYVSSSTPIIIICKKHGEFEQLPRNHRIGHGCPICAKEKLLNLNKTRRKVSLKEFIRRAKEVHGDKYDYSKVKFELTTEKVTIICPEHGEFEQNANSHLMGRGCKLCANKEIGLKGRLTAEEFLARARKIHGDKYEYDLSNYTTTSEKIKITCKKHGDFYQTPNRHMGGEKCPKCAIDDSKLSEEEVLKRFKEVHGDKYKYPNFKYTNSSTHIAIICQKHGIFYQTPHSHMEGRGCPKCAREITGLKCRWEFDEFVKEARKIHGNAYKYIEIIHDNGKQAIIKFECPYHGVIEQRVSGHLKGYGCKHCGVLPTPGFSSGELKIKKFLDHNKLPYIQEWVMPGTTFRFDFYIPAMSLAIEYDGKQHYQYIPFIHGGKIENFYKQVENDREKDFLAASKGISMVRVAYKVKKPYEYLKSIICRIIMFHRDGKYFKNFAEYGKHFNISPKDTMKDHAKYRLSLDADIP